MALGQKITQHVCFSVFGIIQNNVIEYANILSPKYVSAESFSADRSSHFLASDLGFGITGDSLKVLRKNINFLHSAPEIKQEHPLNLSISVSGGKETN